MACPCDAPRDMNGVCLPRRMAPPGGPLTTTFANTERFFGNATRLATAQPPQPYYAYGAAAPAGYFGGASNHATRIAGGRRLKRASAPRLPGRDQRTGGVSLPAVDIETRLMRIEKMLMGLNAKTDAVLTVLNVMRQQSLAASITNGPTML